MRKIILFIILNILFVSNALAQMTNQQVLTKFILGAGAYKKADYKKAIDVYEEVLKSNKESAAIYFNLGNAYFKDGQLGKSILNYERARRLSARDSDIKYNLNYANSLMKNQMPVKGFDLIDRLMSVHNNFYSLDEMVIMIVLIGFSVSILWMVFVFFKQWAKALKWINIFLSVLLCVYILGFIMKYNEQYSQAVMVKDAPANFEPRAQSTAHFELNQGHVIKVLSIENNWAKIKRRDGKQGWVQASDLEKI